MAPISSMIWPRISRSGEWFHFACAALVFGAMPIALKAADEARELDPFVVTADRIEEFGFRAESSSEKLPGSQKRVWVPLIRDVIPNTAAARAGLRPGERILKADGKPTVGQVVLGQRKWNQIEAEKRRVVRASGRGTWVLEIQSADAKATREVTLTLPTPSPHWGTAIWQAPEGRATAVVLETGPLAERAREVLNSGVWTSENGLGYDAGLVADDAANSRRELFLGYRWDITVTPAPKKRILHRMVVSQQRGRTEIIFVVRSAVDRSIPERYFLTSPSGRLEKAWGYWTVEGKTSLRENSPAEAAADFQQEIDFWLKKVGKVSPRWPLELIPDE